MKRSLLVSCLLLCVIHNSYAQNDRAFSKGNSIISAGFGIIDTWKIFLERANDYSTYKVSSKGTFTLVYEYGFSKRISGGIALGYSKVIGKFDGFGQFPESLTTFSILARSNYHFGKFRKFDPYIGGGIGYQNSQYYNNNPILDNAKIPGAFAYSGQLGAHYYFIPCFGAYAELGYVAGTLAQLGLTLKL